MANETSLRSYRDFDAYNRDAGAADAAPRQRDGDPLAELARIMGQNDTYSDLLKSVARTRGDVRPEPHVEPQGEAAEEAHDLPALDLPAMQLRGAVDSDGEDVDWDDLEAELETYMRLSLIHI